MEWSIIKGTASQDYPALDFASTCQSVCSCVRYPFPLVQITQQNFQKLDQILNALFSFSVKMRRIKSCVTLKD